MHACMHVSVQHIDLSEGVGDAMQTKNAGRGAHSYIAATAKKANTLAAALLRLPCATTFRPDAALHAPWRRG